MGRWRLGRPSQDARQEQGGSRARQGSRRIALIYFAVASLWILLSDKLLGLFGSQPTFSAFGTLKGLLFVSATAWMLHALVLRLAATLERSERRLHAALQEREEAVRRKDQFLAALSHELRNPLAPIVTSVRVLERLLPDGDPRVQRSVAIIGRQATHLSRLVDDLLEVTRLVRGKFTVHRSRVDLTALAKQTLADLEPQLSRREIVQRLDDEPVYVSADPVRVQQALGNLLGNAAKFTREGGHIEVSLREEAGRARLEVADDGVGMDAATRGHVFEPFFQADHTLDRKNGGLGLGLAMVKGIAELHGGAVLAQSAGPGKGSRFTLELPLDAGAAAQAPPRPAAGRLESSLHRSGFSERP